MSDVYVWDRERKKDGDQNYECVRWWSLQVTVWATEAVGGTWNE